MRVNNVGRVAIDVVEGNGFGLSAVRVAGDANDDNPIRLVLLRRHADMADETPAVDARTDVEQGADVVARILDGVDRDARSSDMAAVVEKAQAVLKGSGTYYSMLIVVVTNRRIAAAGIGNVSMQLWKTYRSEPILTPTIVVVGKVQVLSNALGLGYDRDRIQRTEVTLHTADRVLIGVQADLGSVPPMHGGESSAEVLRAIIKEMKFEGPAIVGVITAEPS